MSSTRPGWARSQNVARSASPFATRATPIQLGEAACVIRGGSWRHDVRSLRTYARASFPPTFRLDTVGFRVAL